MKTIWKSNIPSFNKLNKTITCDTLIIGGGLAGLWCAYNLTKNQQKVCVLEAKTLGSGVTAGSSAILTYAQELIYAKLIKKHGCKVARQYLNDSKRCIYEIKQVIETEKINCGLEKTNFVLFTTKASGVAKLKEEERALTKLGAEFKSLKQHTLPYKVLKTVSFKDAFLINPLQLVQGLTEYIIKNGGQIFENTMVTTQPKEHSMQVGDFLIKAKNFIIATHYPYINLPGFYFLKLFQSQNYTIAFRPSNEQKNFVKNITYEGIDNHSFEFRKVNDDYALCLGPDVRTGTKQYKSQYKIIENHLNKFFLGFQEITRFSAQDCMSADELPYAGLYSKFTNNIYVLTGFNKWGMTNSYLTAQVVCNIILNKQTCPSNIYAPNRSNLLPSLSQTIKNIGTDVWGWLSNLIIPDTKKISRLKCGEGAIVKLKGKRCGAYKDNEGKLHIIDATCTHMGCGLKWNKDENSFDCPCHGSRFDIHGNIISNPSIKNAHQIKDYK